MPPVIIASPRKLAMAAPRRLGRILEARETFGTSVPAGD